MRETKDPVRLLRTVYFDKETGEFCQCSGDFWKTCPLRVANQLPCQESILSITPVDRENKEHLVEDSLRSLDKELKNLTNKLYQLPKKIPF